MRNLDQSINQLSFEYQNKIISVPMFPELTEGEITKVIEVLNGF